jgi:hypothetical protein
MSPRRASLLTYGFVALFASLSAGRLLTSGTVPWATVAGVAVVAAVAVGPATWLARARIDADRRGILSRLAVVVGMASIPLWFGVALALRLPLLPTADAAVIGITCGGGVALLAERTVLPERFRARHD